MPSDKNKTAFNCDKSVSFADKLCTITDDFIATVENIDLLHSAKNINVAVINMVKALASVLKLQKKKVIAQSELPDASGWKRLQIELDDGKFLPLVIFEGRQDIRIFTNTIKNAINLMKDGGINADMETNSFDWGIEYVIKVKNQ